MKKREKMVESVMASYEGLAAPLHRACERLGYPEELLVTLCATSALSSLGYAVRMVAGSARWRVMDDEAQGDAMLENREVIPNYGYSFDMAEELPKLVKLNYPDNLHTWCETPKGIVYDFTGRHQVEAYESEGAKWPEATKLPPVICGAYDSLALKGWHYKPHHRAGQFLASMITQVFVISAHGGPEP